MSLDLLEQLRQSEVPPPPDDFDRHVHRRLNSSLLLAQLVELFVRALPFAAIHFLRALGGLLTLSLTGRYDPKRKDAE